MAFIEQRQDERYGMEKEIRLLHADEIECRISTINEKGLSLLLFKDARVDQKILDETFSPFGWRRSHQSIDGNLYCTVEVWDEDKKQWIGKQDVGTMSYSQKEKGQASDSFKRACFNWGIGRELYTAPFIWIPAGKIHIQKQNDKYTVSEYFSVQEISYNDQREISSLVIVNSHDAVMYSMKGTAPTAQNAAVNLSEKQLSELQNELDRTGVELKKVLSRYGLHEIGEMTEETFGSAIKSLKKSKSKMAA